MKGIDKLSGKNGRSAHIPSVRVSKARVSPGRDTTHRPGAVHVNKTSKAHLGRVKRSPNLASALGIKGGLSAMGSGLQPQPGLKAAKQSMALVRPTPAFAQEESVQGSEQAQRLRTDKEKVGQICMKLLLSPPNENGQPQKRKTGPGSTRTRNLASSKGRPNALRHKSPST